MTEAVFRHRPAIRAGELGYFPVDDESEQVRASTKVGRDVTLEVRNRRNPGHHRLAFAIFKFLQYHAPIFENVPIDKIKDAIKLATGLVDTFVSADDGKVYYVLKSISFASMDQAAFDLWFGEAVKVIAHRYMPEGTTAESVRTELMKMIDGPGAIGSRVA